MPLPPINETIRFRRRITLTLALLLGLMGGILLVMDAARADWMFVVVRC